MNLGKQQWSPILKLPGGVADWVLRRLRSQRRSRTRLAVLERVSLAPKHSLVLLEVDGRRFLVATSPQGAPAFLALGEADARQTTELEPKPAINWRDQLTAASESGPRW
jgi:flagellar biogenesis protein FliO